MDFSCVLPDGPTARGAVHFVTFVPCWGGGTVVVLPLVGIQHAPTNGRTEFQ